MATPGTRSLIFLKTARSGETSAVYGANGWRQARRLVRRAASVSLAGQVRGAQDAGEPGLGLEGRVQRVAGAVPALHLGIAGAQEEGDAAVGVFGGGVERDSRAALVVEAGEVPEEPVGLPAALQ